MKQKKTIEASPEARRKTLEDDVAAYLAAGNKIDQIPSGTSSQDPQGRGQPLRLGSPKNVADNTKDQADTGKSKTGKAETTPAK